MFKENMDNFKSHHEANGNNSRNCSNPKLSYMYIEPVRFATSIWLAKRMKIGRNGVYVAINSLDHIPTRQKLGPAGSSLLFTNSFEASFTCRKVIDSPTQSHTLIKRPCQPAMGSSGDIWLSW